MTLENGKRVLVRPAGAERETLFVMLLCVAIVLVAGTVVSLRTRAPDVVSIAEWQVDARDGLTAAEQGLNADMKVAADEIASVLAAGSVPTPEELAEEALPPFTKDATSKGRGDHVWSLVPADSAFAGWLGTTASAETAGSLLLRIATAEDGHGHAEEGASSVWLYRSADAAVSGLSNEALIASGWKEIVSRYDASVTRGADQ
ncbi:DUF6162 family protein [Shinella zoogloeoides]|uniref:DUF6162 family protein n=1 Tax=Shinella zoogloeoides TaxID=352475 RepID=UPI00299EB1C2|nr:DUF6162 family protein [Shinella zoogloeoides]WPE22723.1 hypothetical protein ShzoTeo12_39400 [Shinella zoogloeoides]